MKMEDLMKKKVKESISKDVKIILKDNGWKYEGKLIDSDEKYLELLDYKSNSYHIFDLNNIKDFEVKQ